ncbi:MAG: Appr-1-p processing protein [Deltaproteobacteria bacterium CG03_land_8_20_14_0_80_45_14]|nr:MAG: Appr-1-p processing protein [Deltaproteobacteria bacterium CG03_land_8_20_14_0_80_45_14]
MVKVLMGDILKSKAQTLVNTVNCVGIMGKGIALKFKEQFPDMFNDYVARCNRNEVRLGKPYLYKRLTPPWILNFPTKGHWRSVSRIEDIVKGLKYLLQHYKEWGITSLAVPPLGCGQGQLEWKIVGPTLYRYLSQLDIPVELYAPHGTPHEELQPEFLDQEPIDNLSEKVKPRPERVKPAWVALVEVLSRLEQEPYHWPVGRTTFQKIAYIATQEGLPTGLHYQKSSFGPFSPELKGIITRLVNNGLIREEQLGQMFAVKVGPTFADARKAYLNEMAQWESIIEKTTDLFMRMQTRQSEVVATVLFAANTLANRKKEQPSETEVLTEVMQWKQRRRPKLDDKEVAYTIRNLAALRWLKVKPSSDLPIPDEIIAEA